MSLLEVKGLSHRFKDKDIFDDVSFKVFENEHIGLVGVNGAGKSTLMKIISKVDIPDDGDVIWTNNVRIGYMDQHAELGKGLTIMEYLKKSFSWLYDLEKEMVELYEKMSDCSDEEMNKYLERTGIIQDMLYHNNFYEIESEIKKISTGLGVHEFGWDKDVSELSGGQRTKLLLVSLLLKKPDVLLLDEPTNYLDEGHIYWLQEYLKNYEKTFILISHDISFMNSVVNVIYHIENKSITRYKGDYENFKKVYDLEREKMQSSYDRQQKEIKKMETFIAKNIARASTSTMAKSRQKKLDKMERIEITKTDDINIDFSFKESRQPSKVLYELKDVVIGYDKPLSIPLNLKVEKGDKIAIVGTNGLGKSTLLKTILNIIKPISGKVDVGQYIDIGYFKQEENENLDITPYDDVYNFFSGDMKTQQYVRMSLAKCGLKRENVLNKMKNLSGGEQAKVRLCKIVNTPTNILVLDEPTNHLDKKAKDQLLENIKKYSGTVLIVSHEPEFYNQIANKIWDCEKFKLSK